MRRHVRACVIAASVLAQAGLVCAGTLTLNAQAGIGGLGRAGRWAPVRVRIENTDREFRGDIVVSWGDAVVRRALTLASPGRADVVLHVRSADVRDVMSVRLEADGATLRSADVPIHLLSPDDEVTICVGSDTTGTAVDGCTAVVSAAALPSTMWGYDAVDRLRWLDTSADALVGGQRTAFDRWTARGALDAAGIALAPPRPLPVQDDGGRPMRLAAVGAISYVGMLFAAALAGRQFRRKPGFVFVAVAALAGAGSAAALAAGRVGPSAAIVVTHSSLVEQLPEGGSLVWMQASAQFPAFDTFELRARSTEAVVEREHAPQAPVRFAESGEPLLADTLGFAARRRFALEAVVSFSPFRVSRENGAVTATNASRFEYRDCAIAGATSTQAIGVMRPGGSARTTAPLARDSVISCTLSATPMDFSEPRYRVDVEGTTQVAAPLAVSGR